MACVNGIDTITGLPCGNNPTGPTGSNGGNPFIPTYNVNPAAAARNAATNAALAALRQKEFEQIDLPKYQASAAEAAREEAAKIAGAQSMRNYYEDLLRDETRFRQPTDAYLKLLGGAESTAKEAIEGQYEDLGAALEKAYNAGVTLSSQGFGALRDYLERNQPIAFAQAQRASVTPQVNLIEQYARQRGIATPGVEQAVQEANVLAAGGAQNYNNLLNLLTTLGQRAQTSRLSEAEMAGTVNAAQLRNRLLAGQTQAQQAQAAALANLTNQYNTARLQAESALLARRQSIQDALAKILGTGLTTAPPVTPTGPTGPTGPTSPLGPTVGVNPVTKQPYDMTYVPPGTNIAPGVASPNTPQAIIDAIVANPTIDPGIVAAAISQNVAPQVLDDLASRGTMGNPMFGALQDRLFMV